MTPSRTCARPTSVLLALALTGGGLTTLAAPASAAPVGGELFYGLTATDQLVTFRSGSGALLSSTAIGGLDAGDNVVGIDVRPSTGVLYAVAQGNAAGADSLYTINPATAAATKVADLNVDLDEGTRFGVDINPVADALRVVSESNQNLAINLTTGAVTEQTDLTNTGAGTPPDPTVTAAAYTNSVAGAATTTLFDLDVTRNVLQTQVPATGVLSGDRQLLATASTAGSDAGFDIDGLTQTGYAVLDVAGQRGLYRVDLSGNGATPAATRVGDFVLPGVVDIAVATPRLGFATATATVPESDPFATFTITRVGDLAEPATVQFATTNGTATAGSDYTATTGTATFAAGAATATITVPVLDDEVVEGAEDFTITLSNPSAAAVLLAQRTLTATITSDDAGSLLFGLTSDDGLVQIRTETGIVGAARDITGVALADDLLGIDVRPATGQLIALARNTVTGAGSVYSINPTTGVATRLFGLTNGTAGVTLPAAQYGIDVNPVVDALRVVNSLDDNLRVNLTTGATTVDPDLSPGAPVVTGIAYTSSAAGATSTELYDVDTAGDDLYQQTSPNDGTLAARAPLGVDATGDVGYDIDGATGVGYASLTVGGTTGLYEIVEAPTVSTAPAARRLGTFALPGVVDVAVATPRITVTNQTVAEGATATITVTRSGDTSRSATVTYATSSGTATSGTDFTATSGTLSFAAGETSKTFTVVTTPDAVTEDAETAVLTLSNPTGGAVVGAPGTLTITDVVRGGFSVAATRSVAEGTASINVVVTRSAPTAGTATVQYATANGTATAGTDYTATSGTLTFAAGETSKTVVVPLLNDTLVEPDETFSFVLSNPTGTGALGTPSSQTVTITNDDGGTGAFSVAPTQTVSEKAGTATVTVQRSTPATGAAQVSYATSNGTATAGGDYTATSGTLSFADGETSKTFTVPVTDDTVAEANETFTVTLSNPSTGTTVAGATQTVTITSDDAAKAATSVSIDATPLVRFPAAPVITGVLRGANGAPLAGRTVNIISKQQAVPGLQAFRPTATRVTDANGVYRLSIRPTVNTVWQAIYLGNDSEAASGSAYDVTKVQIGIPTVNGFGRTVTVRANTRVNVSGTIQPAALRHPLVLQWIRPSGIVNLTPAVRANSNGTYVVGRGFAKGTYRLRVLGVTTPNNVASASRTILLRVV